MEKHVDGVIPKARCLKKSTYAIHCVYIVTDLVLNEIPTYIKFDLNKFPGNPCASQGVAVMCTGV